MFNKKLKERLDKLEETQQKIIDFLEIEEEKYIGQSIISGFDITKGLNFEEIDTIKTRFVKKKPSFSDEILNQAITLFKEANIKEANKKPKKK